MESTSCEQKGNVYPPAFGALFCSLSDETASISIYFSAPCSPSLSFLPRAEGDGAVGLDRRVLGAPDEPGLVHFPPHKWKHGVVWLLGFPAVLHGPCFCSPPGFAALLRCSE